MPTGLSVEAGVQISDDELEALWADLLANETVVRPVICCEGCHHI
jgi:hypothetical protein